MSMGQARISSSLRFMSPASATFQFSGELKDLPKSLGFYSLDYGGPNFLQYPVAAVSALDASSTEIKLFGRDHCPTLYTFVCYASFLG